MKIIGHRGAAGLATENTRESFESARKCGVVMIECDLRITRDGVLVLGHDADTARISNHKLVIADSTYAELRAIEFTAGTHILTLEEAFEAAGATPLMIEIKSSGCVERLVQLLDQHTERHDSVASFLPEELRRLHDLRPHIPTYLLTHDKPFEILRSAKRVGASGVGYNYGLLNPFNYWLIRHRRLGVYVYTMNNPRMARIFQFLYPQALICTDRPDYFVNNYV